jgi:hypothetical protein
MTDATQTAPHNPRPATPVGAANPAFGNPETAPAAPKRSRNKSAPKSKAKKAARKRVLTKKDTKAILGRGGARRVAALSVDFAQAMQMAAGLKKKDVAAIQAVVQLLNPLARPARKRVMEAVAGVLS